MWVEQQEHALTVVGCFLCACCLCCFSARAFETLGTRCLGVVAPEDRQEDEWTSLQMFADALNKKFNKDIMRQLRTNQAGCGHASFSPCLASPHLT